MTAQVKAAVDVLATVDLLDSSGFAELFTHDARLVLGNGEPMIGRHEIASGTSSFFATIAGLQHTVLNEWIVGSTTIVELSVAYQRRDGGTVRVPVASIWHHTPQGLIDDYRVFFDLTPVFGTGPVGVRSANGG